jgi:DNA-binding transcriptional regulator YiaG
MPDIGLIFRQELRRIAARELRRLGGTSSALERRFLHIQKRNRLLQRRLTVISREISKLRVQLDRRIAPARQDRQLIPSADLPSPQEVRFLRRSLGLSRLKFAKRLGVSSGSIFGWETGRTVPRGSNAARIRSLAEDVARGSKKGPVARKRPTRRTPRARRRARRAR